MITYNINRLLVSYSIVLTVSCGTAGNDLSRGSKCIGGGNECHAGDPSPTPSISNILGSPGPSGVPGRDGKDSNVPGPVGPKGDSGSSCSVLRGIGGSLISCTDGTTAVVLDGADAPPTPYTVIGMVDPCGKQTTYDEVLLRLSNNSLLAHYASGSLQYLTVIGPGTYITTDGTNCYFTVNSDLSISGEHN